MIYKNILWVISHITLRKIISLFFINITQYSKKSKKNDNQETNNTKFDIGIFIFRRDLRIEDNRGLINLSSKCKNIIPIFNNHNLHLSCLFKDKF